MNIINKSIYGFDIINIQKKNIGFNPATGNEVREADNYRGFIAQVKEGEYLRIVKSSISDRNRICLTEEVPSDRVQYSEILLNEVGTADTEIYVMIPKNGYIVYQTSNSSQEVDVKIEKITNDEYLDIYKSLISNYNALVYGRGEKIMNVFYSSIFNINMDLMIDGKFVDYKNGNEIVNSAWSCSDYIDISGYNIIQYLSITINNVNTSSGIVFKSVEQPKTIRNIQA